MQIGQKVTFHTPLKNTERTAVDKFGKSWVVFDKGSFVCAGIPVHGFLIAPGSLSDINQHFLARWVLPQQIDPA